MTLLPSRQSISLPSRHFLRDLLVILSLWILIGALFWKIALAGRVLAGGDIFTYFYPYWAEATRAIRAGRLPLWNPYLFTGVPFLANSQVGFFYPLNWPLWLLLPAHRSVHLTIILHLCLAALNAYIWGRTSLRLGRVGAWTAGATFALGGYLGAQVEHINQLQGLAWLPLMLTLYDTLLLPHPDAAGMETCPTFGLFCRSAFHSRWFFGNRRVAEPKKAAGVRRKAFAGLAIVIGLVLLAGHTQTAFISLVGLAIYGLGPGLWEGLREGAWADLMRRAVILILAATLGIALAGVQLIPTGELSRHSIRAAGLPFNERVSFSLSPLYLARALLPGFVNPVPPERIEFVAYIGITGIALAIFGAINNLRNRRAETHLPIYLLTIVGLFLALGLYNPLYLFLARYVPGFAHFRAPARWLALYVIGMSALAGRGAQMLWNHQAQKRLRFILTLTAALALLIGWGAVGRATWQAIALWTIGSTMALGLLLIAAQAPRTATVGLLLLLIGELFAASATLPHTRATAPQAFTSLRPTIAHLLAAGSGQKAPGRFLSMSDITFDPGDLSAIRTIYGPQLSDAALYEYIIAAKQKEVLSPNLPLAFGIPALDGYGGGLLPLARYVTLQRLFLPESQVSIDGRLRENLTAVPDGRWLSLFNVQYLITDKLRDAWLDDVFYDLQFGARLSHGEAAITTPTSDFEATTLGLVSRLSDKTALPAETPVGALEVTFKDRSPHTLTLRAGELTSAAETANRLQFAEPATPVTITLQAMLPRGELIVRGVSLIDERTGGFQSLILSDQGRFRLVHSGDVKIYENLDVLPRAFLVHEAEVVWDDDHALMTMRNQSFDPTKEVVLIGESTNPPPLASPTAQNQDAHAVRMIHHTPGRIEIDVTTEAPGYLVLTDAWYPGWTATVDGEPTAVHRANLHFRAVAVETGRHRIVFAFHSMSLYVGAAISLTALLGLGILLKKN